jgi:hypothetical protein
MNLHYHRFRSIQALCLTLSVFLPTVGLNPITVNASQKVPPREKVDSFIIEMINGKATCRGANRQKLPRRCLGPRMLVFPSSVSCRKTNRCRIDRT